MNDYLKYVHVKVSINGSELNSYCFEDSVVNIGRGSDCQIVLDNPGISRVHARIEREGDNLRIFDNDSGNGTFVNGTQVEKTWVNSGDTVRIGKFTLNIRLSPIKGTISPSASSSEHETVMDNSAANGQTIELSADDRKKILLQAQAMRAKANITPAKQAKSFSLMSLVLLFIAGTVFGLLVSWLAN